ncbi:GHKL domain-containing protein [Candidatus Falkowbacteria bacterium]|nr:GHKL domain-containing protein [Candidatus Falkowbacteria bacterium]
MLIVGNLIGQLFSLLSLIFIIGLSFFVLRNKKHLVNRIFFFLTLILDLWLIGSFMMFASYNTNQIIFWDRFIYFGVVFWPSLQYHFGLAITYFNKKRRIYLGLAYIMSFAFLILSRTDYFVKDVFFYKWGYHSIAQFYHNLFIVFFLVYTSFFLVILFKKYKKDKNRIEKKRVKYFVVGFMALNIMGGIGFFPAYGIAVFPIALAAPLIFSIIISYAIVYFGLMDVKLIARRYFVYTLSLIQVLSPIYIFLLYINRVLPGYLFLISLPLVVFAFPIFYSVKEYFYRLSNKYFFSSLYDANEVIFELNNCLRSSLDISQIFSSTVDVLRQAFNSKAVAVIYYNYKEKSWSVLYNYGFNFKPNPIKWDYCLFKKIFFNNKPLSINTITPLLRKKNHDILVGLRNLSIQLLVPIKIKKDRLSSVMIFGPKESNESYNDRDNQVLESIASQIGISLENALLYKKMAEFNISLKKEVVKATKKLKEQNEALKQLDKAKSEFIGIASHQLRTPLTGIRWFNELLLKNKEKNLNDKQINFLNQINESNQRMIKLVNDLLDVSHIETGRKFEVVLGKFKIAEIIQDVIQENAFLINNKKLKINNKIPEDLVIFADRDKIRQVLLNLLSNATKYSAEGKVITISASRQKKQATICVTDQGIGIPEKQQKNIFSKFFRASNASLQNSNGTGLGLYIAREVVRAHNGELWFESKEGWGSTFCFSLSLEENKVPEVIKKNKKYKIN